MKNHWKSATRYEFSIQLLLLVGARFFRAVVPFSFFVVLQWKVLFVRNRLWSAMQPGKNTKYLNTADSTHPHIHTCNLCNVHAYPIIYVQQIPFRWLLFKTFLSARLLSSALILVLCTFFLLLVALFLSLIPIRFSVSLNVSSHN